MSNELHLTGIVCSVVLLFLLKLNLKKLSLKRKNWKSSYNKENQFLSANNDLTRVESI